MVLEVFMIDISKAQLEANLRATMQMREAAERAFHRVKEVLVDLALQFLIRLTSTAISPPQLGTVSPTLCQLISLVRYIIK
jgi:hypothetical protein